MTAVTRPLLGTRRAGGMRERPRINLHKLGNAFLGDPATHFIRRRQFAALFPGFESAARAHDQLARWKSLFWPFSLTVTVRGPLKFKKNLGVDRVVVPCQLSLGRVWIRKSVEICVNLFFRGQQFPTLFSSHQSVLIAHTKKCSVPRDSDEEEYLATNGNEMEQEV